MTIRPYRYYLIDLDRTLWDFDSNSEHAIGLLVSRNPVLYRAVQEKEGYGESSLHRFFMRYDKLNHRCATTSSTTGSGPCTKRGK